MYHYVLTDRCSFQPDSGPCRAYIPSYFYNVTSGNCEQFIYGGCGGNSNRFRTAAECVAHCSKGCKELKVFYVCNCMVYEIFRYNCMHIKFKPLSHVRSLSSTKF